MGNRRTENSKRSAAVMKRRHSCHDCYGYWTGDALNPHSVFVFAYCDAHGCSGVTRKGTRCRNGATYPGEKVCGIHLKADA